MKNTFLDNLFQAHKNAENLPSPQLVCNAISRLLQILFPQLSDHCYSTKRALEQGFNQTRLDFFNVLRSIQKHLPTTPEQIEQEFIERLPFIRETLLLDAETIAKGDPAAISDTEVIRTYPGFLAIAVYRIAHELYCLKVPFIPRILTEHAHSKTGIDIHPGAKIGKHFFIDHGTGIVIGETVEIGSQVKIYQGVTLGALSISKDMTQVKRHPTIEDGVVIYAGATILGGKTIIGRGSVVGGNVWITKSVPAYSRLYHHALVIHKNEKEGVSKFNPSELDLTSNKKINKI